MEAVSFMGIPTFFKHVYPMNGVFRPSNSFLAEFIAQVVAGIATSSSSSWTEKLDVSSGEANTGLKGGVAGGKNK